MGKSVIELLFTSSHLLKKEKKWSTPKAESKYVSVIVMLYILTLSHDLHINLDVNFLKF